MKTAGMKTVGWSFNTQPGFRPATPKRKGKDMRNMTRRFSAAHTWAGFTAAVLMALGVVSETRAGGVTYFFGDNASITNASLWSDGLPSAKGDDSNSGIIRDDTRVGTLDVHMSPHSILVGGWEANRMGTTLIIQDGGHLDVYKVNTGTYGGSGTNATIRIEQGGTITFDWTDGFDYTFGGSPSLAEQGLWIIGGTLNAKGGYSGGGRVRMDGGTFNITDFNPDGIQEVTITDKGGTFDITGTKTFNAGWANASGATTGLVTKAGAGTLVLGGTNTYGGNTMVNAGTLNLRTNGVWRFKPSADGSTCNRIGGDGTLQLDGTLLFDLAGLKGGSWKIVEVETLAETYGATFAVSSTNGPFTKSGSVWSRDENGTTFTFSQATGVLKTPTGTVISIR